MSACLQKKTGCWFYPIIYSIYIYIIRGLQIARTVSSTARLGGWGRATITLPSVKFLFVYRGFLK